MSKIILLLPLVWSLNCFAEYAIVRPAVENVDLLFVIDDSGSMHFHQEKVAKNIKDLMASFVNADLQIGITTTSASVEVNRYSWERSTELVGSSLQGSFEDVQETLERDLIVGFRGSHREKVAEPILNVLADPKNQGFLRQESRLVIVVVTDAEDQSEIDGLEFLIQLSAFKPIEKISFNAFIPLNPKGMSCMKDGPQSSLESYVILSRLLNGQVFDLCSSDWSSYKLQ